MPESVANAREFICGRGVSIGERTVLGSIGGPAESIELGDYVQIDDDVRILAPHVYIGDYTRISHHVTIYGYDTVYIGPCGWIGQNVILNCTDLLHINRGCTISAYTNIWTHFTGGDAVEGSRFDSAKPCKLGEDVWLGVQCNVAPVDIGDKALVLAGSVIAKDIPTNTVWGGNPAINLTNKLGEPYTARTIDDKYALLCYLLERFAAGERRYEHGLSQRLPELLEKMPCEPSFTKGGITVIRDEKSGIETGQCFFNVSNRTYTKRGSDEEIAFMKYLLPMVKFYPCEEHGKRQKA